ncbi:hypothetical protein AR457_34665 [Streptomyces agglomeratus]|uniref:Chaplin domain-containing protein n=1 Tax=Streptomyces agglomeratus TaxID=285458 RepID=A0A1E5PGW8_9ACTN|nr:hypothetical protein [Streptomyces agglomeratus]OEJ28772.1 hypothetical protein AS594_34340 [Streptomyces agglomeratus]OEJ37150.1 hypothetical protein BGK70_02160 [Streptomyces agglomeratus]OEJ48503.1 hypothetical protein AR457_34665 [Streptomyces agglomeratus]OEJ49704.1 hypothetical protein BGK72_01710 [Streptomyces agglomeratus]OEJ57003.1 hypothetical protein BGM19_02195 [Streptomyces agglomeratus]
MRIRTAFAAFGLPAALVADAGGITAADDPGGINTVTGNGASQIYGDTSTQPGLVQGTPSQP